MLRFFKNGKMEDQNNENINEVDQSPAQDQTPSAESPVETPETDERLRIIVSADKKVAQVYVGDELLGEETEYLVVYQEGAGNESANDSSESDEKKNDDAPVETPEEEGYQEGDSVDFTEPVAKLFGSPSGTFKRQLSEAEFVAEVNGEEKTVGFDSIRK